MRCRYASYLFEQHKNGTQGSGNLSTQGSVRGVLFVIFFLGPAWLPTRADGTLHFPRGVGVCRTRADVQSDVEQAAPPLMGD